MEQQHVESVLEVVERHPQHTALALILVFAGIVRLIIGWTTVSPASKKNQASSSASLHELAVFETQNDVWAKIQEGHSKASTNPSHSLIGWLRVDCCKKYPDDPFVLSMMGMRVVILPHSSIDVIKALPESCVSIK